MNIDVPGAIRRHLFDRPAPVNGVRYQSSFYALLTEARWASGRNPDTGVVIDEPGTARWLGAAAYLMLLDQIGNCLQSKNAPPVASNRNGAELALEYFAGYQNAAEFGALYALRNAFAHHYSLFNHKPDRPRLHHAFNLTADTVTPLVTLPNVQWSGSYAVPIPADQITLVNIRKLSDLVEQIVTTLRTEHTAGRLDIRMPAEQFVVKYAMAFSA